MTAYPLTPVRFRAFDKNGQPLIGGQVYAYEAGSTTTEKDTYSDKSMDNFNTYPVILDDTGSASIYISGDYFFQIFDADGNLIEEGDGIADAESIAQNLIDNNSSGSNSIEQRVTDLESARDEHTDQINDLIDDTTDLQEQVKNEVETERDKAIKAAVDAAKTALKEDFEQQLIEVVAITRIKIGDIYITLNPENPSARLGYGVWELISKGKAIVGLSDITSDPSWTKILGGAFGEFQHTLTVPEIPSHSHAVGYSTNTTGSGVINGTASAANGSNPSENTGGGEPHNIVQPSMVFAIWKRIT
ncbi:phage baseplate protein [Acinetobacter sp. ULE_I010]|uniref:phage baseplate protein n=1 Tax=Acinetobacter sp. ULE_I010 TaxID=3373065 RepID=UPI003AF630A1